MNRTILNFGTRYPKALVAVSLLVAASYAVRSYGRAESAPKPTPTKLGIVIYSGDPETVWNAFRFASFAQKQGDQVKVFLLAKGVESESLDNERFKVTEQMKSLVDQGGEILACGTCLKLRHAEGTKLCPVSNLQDLYKIVKESDKVLSF